MANNYSQHWDEAARRRRAADVERQHDQQDRHARAIKEQWRRAQDRRLAADAARRRRSEDAHRRVQAYSGDHKH